MQPNDFAHIRHWVFDLDHTLYPPSSSLFDQIEVRMTQWVMDALNVSRDQADHLRETYWAQYGTTLAGLMREHDVDPEGYLIDVHDIDFSVLSPNPDLAQAIRALPGRKIIYTNGTAPYARNVLDALALDQEFEAIYGVEHANYLPKPERAAFDTVFALDSLDPARAAMFEDSHKNLIAPHHLGMRTVLVGPKPMDEAHIHHHTNDLTGFLSQLSNLGETAKAP